MPPVTFVPHGIEFCTSKRRVSVRDEYAVTGFYGTLATSTAADFLNGTSRPRLVVPLGVAHVAPDAAVAVSAGIAARAEARRAAVEGPRREALTRAINRNGWDAISHAQTGPAALDTFRPRATRAPPPQSDYIKWETAARSRDDLRFHRLLDPADARLQARSQVLLDAGLPGLAARRRSSAIGYGRADVPSRGAADAFAASAYGGTAWVAPEGAPPALAESRRRAAGGARGGGSVVDEDNHDAADAAARFDAEVTARRRAATARQPNRVFDVTSAPVILVTKPDAVAADVRRERELQAARAAAGVAGGAAAAAAVRGGSAGAAGGGTTGAYAAAAEALAARRARSAKSAEVRMVQSLRI